MKQKKNSLKAKYSKYNFCLIVEPLNINLYCSDFLLAKFMQFLFLKKLLNDNVLNAVMQKVGKNQTPTCQPNIFMSFTRSYLLCRVVRCSQLSCHMT